MSMKLHIACGQHKQKGYKGIDRVAAEGVDFVWDLEQYPWVPLKENSCTEIYIENYFEQVKNPVAFMNEVYRICQDEAVVKILAPYQTSMKAWQNPMTVRPVSEATFVYFDKTERDGQKLPDYGAVCNFKTEKLVTFLNEPWNNKSEEAKQFAQRHYVNVVSDIYVELKAIK